MKVFLPLTLLLLVMVNIRSIDCLTLTERYFLTMDLTSTVAPVNIRKALGEIRNTLCSPKSDSLKCYLTYKVVGEARVIVNKNATEVIALWKAEAEIVIKTRNAGVPLELFKTLGERTVHLLTERDATEFDQRLFVTPFYQEIHSTLKTTCKTIVTF